MARQNLVPVGMPLELDNEPSQPEARTLPADACRATFDRAPKAARNARTLAPCHLKRGHSGRHENDRGVSWTSRGTAPRTETRSTTPVDAKTLNARHAQLAKTMQGRSSAPAAPAYRPPTGPLAAARRAIDASKTPLSIGGELMPSQLAYGMRELERTGDEILRLAAGDETTMRYRGPQVATLRRKLQDAHAVNAPGYQGPDLRPRDLVGLRDALDTVLTPMETQAREMDRFRRGIARAARMPRRPAPRPEPHPWDRGGDAA
ncbi:hypothetical protein [Streptomyces zhihengii]